MFKSFRTIPGKLRYSMSLPHLPKYEPCHRKNCLCVSEIKKNMFNIIRTSENHESLTISKRHYEQCYKASKKWIKN